MSYGIEPSADPIRPGNTRPVTITVDGSPVTGVLGQTLAGVMLSAGIEAWRRTSALDRPRGVFCGIGVCFDCVAVVNGLSDVSLPAPRGRGRRGDVPPSAAELRARCERQRQVTVLVIGAGPAGLAASLAAIDAGEHVVLLDAADDVGGQYWRHLPPTRPSANEAALHHGWSTFLTMRERLLATPCEIVTSAHVWAIDHAGVHVLVGVPDGRDREQRIYRADAIVVATGAFDRVLPVPGWDLPGVYSAGGAQALAKGERVAVGRRVIIAGAGPFLLPVAVALLQAGSTVVGVLEASRASTAATGWAARPWELVGARAKIPSSRGTPTSWRVTAFPTQRVAR